MPNFQLRNFSLGWHPDADAENAPPGVALRADNLVLDETGAITVRRGSSLLDEGLVGGEVHTLQSMPIDGIMQRFAGVGDKLYRNGVDSGMTFAGMGDLAIGTDAYQAFVARGITKKKYDGESFINWEVPAPELAPTLTAANAVTLTTATFASAESPVFTVTEGTRAFVTGADTVANGASEFTVNAAGHAAAYKVYAADTEMLNIAGTVGTDTDIFDMYAALSNLDQVNHVTVMFGLNTGADPFKDDYFWFTWNLKGDPAVDLKDAKSSLPGVMLADARRVTEAIRPEDVTLYKSPQEVVGIKGQVGAFGNPQSTTRPDSVHSSPAWFHYSTTRGQFSRTGNTADRDWTTVRGMKVVVNAVPASAITATFDTALWYGGGARALSGNFLALYVAVRDTGNYFELSRPSPISEPITLNQNGLNVQIPAAALSALDAQVNQLWVYLFSANLGGWYRFAITGSTQSSGMSIDEFDPTPDATIDAADRTRFNNWGLAIPGFSGDGSLTVVIQKSESDALREGVRLVPYLSGPPDNIVAIAGPYLSRMYALTAEGWLYVSAQGSPSHFSAIQIQDFRRYGDPYWMVLTNGGLYVGMSGDIVQLGGTGNEDINANADFYPQPLGVGNPPVDKAVYTDGSTVVYRAADGLMTLTGITTTPVTQQGITLLWRGQDRHGVEALNIVDGRFRLAVDNHVLYMLAPEGDKYTPLVGSEDAQWSSVTGATVANGILTKTTANSWSTMGAVSDKYLLSGDGYVEHTITNNETDRVFGFSHAGPGLIYTSIDFAIYLHPDHIFLVYEFGVPRGPFSTWEIGDTVRIAVVDGEVVCSKNGVVFRTCPQAPTYPLQVDVTMFRISNTLGPLTISGNWTSAANLGTNIMYRFDTIRSKWYRTVYSNNLWSLHRDPNGRLITGDADGNVWLLENGSQDNGANIDILLRTPISDNGQALRRKTAFDLTVNGDTGGDTLTLDTMLDGSVASAASYEVASTGDFEYRQAVYGLADFSRLQWSITGSFRRFVLRGINLSYRPHPQQRMAVDTGYLRAPGNSDLAWVEEVEISARTSSDLELIPYFDDVAEDTITIIAQPGAYTVYRVPLLRGQNKGRKPRFLLQTTAVAAVGNPGFELEWMRVRFRGTGNESEKIFQIAPDETAQ